MRIPPKIPISELLRILKGKTARRLFLKLSYLKQKLYWDNDFGLKDIALIWSLLMQKWCVDQDEHDKKHELQSMKLIYFRSGGSVNLLKGLA